MIKIGKRFGWISVSALAMFFAVRSTCVAVPTAADAFTALGPAGPSHWQVLEVGTGTITEQVDLSNPQGGITGNVGIQKNGKLQDSGPIIHGDLYLGDNAQASFSGSATVTGKVHLGNGAKVTPNSLTQVHDNPQPLLDAARTAAINASATAALVPATSTRTSINLSHTTLNLSAGVYNLKDFILDHTKLTLTGKATDYFIFNISNPNINSLKNGTFKLSSGKIVLAGGISESHVLFNYMGTKDVAFSGGGNDSVLHGIILALNANVNLAPGLVVGEIISGKNISIVSGAQIKPPSVPDSGSTLTLGLIGFGILATGYVRARRFPIFQQARN